MQRGPGIVVMAEYCKNGHKRTPESTFRRKNGGRKCRICMQVSDNLRYLKRKNDPIFMERVRATEESRANSRKRFLSAVRSTAGCVDCGATDGRLDFDHRPGTIKLFNVSSKLANRRFAALVEEVEKCDVRCVSCHARRHALERWARHRSGEQPYYLSGRQ